MSRSCKTISNRGLRAWVRSPETEKPKRLRDFRYSLARAFLASAFLVTADSARANEVLDGNFTRNVTTGVTFDAAGYLIVGGNTTGYLNIASGGHAINADAYVGFNGGSHGEVFVAGAGATWTTNGYLIIGLNGEAFVMVDDGASIIAQDGIAIADGAGSFAQLTLSGTGSSRGLLSTLDIMKGYGAGLLYWDGGILQARGSDPNFLKNFDYLDIDIRGNGAFFDTNGFDVGVQTPGILIGSGGLTKLGAGNLTIAGTNSWSGDTAVNAGTLTLDTYLQSGGQILTIGVAGSASYGKLNVNGVATFNNSNLEVDVIGSPVLVNNTSLAGVITAGTLNAGSFTVTDNSALFDVAATINGNSVDLNVSTSGAGITVYSSVLNSHLYPALGAARVLDTQVQGAPTGDMANIVTALGQLPDERSVARAAAQTLPFNAGAHATLGALGTINSIFESRFAAYRPARPTDHFATGQNFWITPLGSIADQNDTDGNASGYSAKTWGLAAGVEGDLGETQIGFAYAYARTHIDGNSSLSGAGTSAEIDSNVVAAYGSHPLADVTLGFQIDAGWNSADSRRILDFGGINRSARGTYDSWNMHVGGDLSQAIVLDEANTFIPRVRADYTRLRSQSYTEHGAGALNLDVAASTVEALTLGIDGRVVHMLSPNSQIEATVGVSYDAINDYGPLIVEYAGAPGQSFVAGGIDHGPWLAKAGVGYAYSPRDGMNVTLNYNAGWRNDYVTQSLAFKAAWSF